MIPSSIKILVDSDYIVQPPEDNILELVLEHRHRQCTNLCDKVYALLGLTQSRIRVDYASPVEHLLLELLRYACKVRKIKPQMQSHLVNTSITIAEILEIKMSSVDHRVVTAIAQQDVSHDRLVNGTRSSNLEISKICSAILEGDYNYKA
jgi:hypothetical protein